MYILVYHCTLTNSRIYMNKNHIGVLWSSIANYLSSKFQNQQHHWKPPIATLPILYQYPEHIVEEATLSLQYLPIPLSPQHFLEEAQEPKLPQLLYHYDSCPYLTLHSTLYGRPRGPNTRGNSTTMISVHTSLFPALYMGGPGTWAAIIVVEYLGCLGLWASHIKCCREWGMYRYHSCRVPAGVWASGPPI